MNFQAAFSYLKRGHDITLPEWGGFWRWDAQRKTIMMHTRKGEILDIRQSNDMDYTLGFTFRTDWELVKKKEFTPPPPSVPVASPFDELNKPNWKLRPDAIAGGCHICGRYHLGQCPEKYSLSMDNFSYGT